MNVRVLFFASLKDAVGTGELTLAVTEAVSLDALIAQLASVLPESGLSALRAENIRVAVNQTLISNTGQIEPGDEVAFLPPVTGG